MKVAQPLETDTVSELCRFVLAMVLSTPKMRKICKIVWMVHANGPPHGKRIEESSWLDWSKRLPTKNAMNTTSLLWMFF